MNVIVNDKGERVAAVGAPGSLMRVIVEYPLLIEKINALREQGLKAEDAVKEIAKLHPTLSKMERTNILIATKYGNAMQ